jgi:putative ABC transport system permease protein
MIRNYFKMAWRSLLKQKGFSFINIFGLATGMACSLLIFLFVKDETSYDRFHHDAGQIYRVVKDFVNDDGSPFTRCNYTTGVSSCHAERYS